MNKKFGFFAPPSLWFCSHPKIFGVVHKPVRHFIRSMMNLRMLADQLTDQDLEEISELLDSAAIKIEEIVKRSKQKKG